MEKTIHAPLRMTPFFPLSDAAVGVSFFLRGSSPWEPFDDKYPGPYVQPQEPFGLKYVPTMALLHLTKQ